MPESRWDVVILGAGPAGALTATLAARNGARTLLLERAAFPRHKVCGCCLAEQGQQILEQHGLASVMHNAQRPDHTRIQINTPGKSPATASIRSTTHATIARDAMDAALVQHAIDAGAIFRDNAPARLDPANAAVRVQNEILRTRTVIIADGLASASLRDDPRFRWRTQRLSRVGLGSIVESETDAARALAREFDPHTITMTAARAGYVGVAALPNDRWAIAAAIDPEAIRTTPGAPREALRTIFRQSNQNTDWLDSIDFKGVPTLTRHRNIIEADGRVFLVGDAAAYVEPFTGEGMSWALLSASQLHHHMLAALAGRYRPGDWTRQSRRGSASRHLFCKAVAGILRRPTLARALVRTLAAQPRLADRFASLALAHTTKPRRTRTGAGWAAG